jgi:ribonucleotide reductase beta subunit family protein with ferritin-like domain
MLETYVTDPTERNQLFNAITTMPCVARKAQWALKWISSDEPFPVRLVAFAIVEGVFFSGAFCAIYWLAEGGRLDGLRKSNDFISRDEGLHTDFACLLYKKYCVNKMNSDRFSDLLLEAVAIEKEFINDALPCRLIGMNSESMSEYIDYVAARLCKQLGHEPPAALSNAKQPFAFMDRIGLISKSNFFEDRPSEYRVSVEQHAAGAYDDL